MSGAEKLFENKIKAAGISNIGAAVSLPEPVSLISSPVYMDILSELRLNPKKENLVRCSYTT